METLQMQTVSVLSIQQRIQLFRLSRLKIMWWLIDWEISSTKVDYNWMPFRTVQFYIKSFVTHLFGLTHDQLAGHIEP